MSYRPSAPTAEYGAPALPITSTRQLRSSPMTTADRCPAAHPDDPTPCDGPVVVAILDRKNAGAKGCEHHGARLLASLEGGRVYPLPDAPEGAAIRVFKAADGTRPFAWYEDAPRTQPSQLSRAEVRAAGLREIADAIPEPCSASPSCPCDWHDYDPYAETDGGDR